ncbi:MAG: DUF5009 domain-containing protein [Phycisphaerales bacterium]|nr:DUF5009 domain-containing protein [Phycisphaerales bacterium]
MSAPTPVRRADALDALRGLAILGMALSGMLPFGTLPDGGTLPTWMYHAQTPPPAHLFDGTLAGLTWVDLVFPFFLFTMGAAMPLALSRRLEVPGGWWRLPAYLLSRGALIALFALYAEHVQPWKLSNPPTTQTWLVVLLAFAIPFAILVELPARWSLHLRGGCRAAGWAAAITLLAMLPHPPDGTTFDLKRTDPILAVLSNVAVAGGLLWAITRNHVGLRVGLLVALLGFRLAAGSDGWSRAVWNWSPLPSQYQFYFLQYLAVVIPGTLAGDVLREWLRPAQPPARPQTPTPRALLGRPGVLALLILALHGVLLGGLQSRQVTLTVVLTLALCAGAITLFARPTDSTSRLLRSLCGWATLWLVVGLIFEPYEGGIRKDRATISYFYVTAGLATYALAFFFVLIDHGGLRRPCVLLIANGQNPMLAYLGIRNLAPPLLHLSGLEGWLVSWTRTPWLGALRGILKTLFLAALVAMFTRLRLIWRT